MPAPDEVAIAAGNGLRFLCDRSPRALAELEDVSVHSKASSIRNPVIKLAANRRGPEEVKRDGWREQGLLAVAIDDHRLAWPEREMVRQLREKLYGAAIGGREVLR